MRHLTETSFGEIVDKLTIIRIKKENIENKEKRVYLHKEDFMLSKIYYDQMQLLHDSQAYRKIEIIENAAENLYKINSTLWAFEDSIRNLINKDSYGDSFIQIAREIPKENDKRAKEKAKINKELGSTLDEVKSYQ
jgi:hypothetical protein